MKFQICFKNPDADLCLVKKAREILESQELTEHEIEDLIEEKVEDMEGFIKSWVIHREYVMIEFDTEKGTAKIIEVEDAFDNY